MLLPATTLHVAETLHTCSKVGADVLMQVLAAMPACLCLQDTEVLELQQQAAYRQQIQKLQQADEDAAAERDQEATARAEAAAFAAANKAAAAAYQQQADAEAAAEAVERRAAVRSAAEPARPPADMFKFDLSLLDSDIPGHAQLMQVLLGFRHDMVEGLTGVTSTMQVRQRRESGSGVCFGGMLALTASRPGMVCRTACSLVRRRVLRSLSQTDWVLNAVTVLTWPLWLFPQPRLWLFLEPGLCHRRSKRSCPRCRARCRHLQQSDS